MGPTSAKSYPGVRLLPAIETSPQGPHASLAKQEIDYGRRGKGYLFGALQAATGAVLTEPYPRRKTANWVGFLEQVDAWVSPEAEHIYAILDNLEAHRATDV